MPIKFTITVEQDEQGGVTVTSDTEGFRACTPSEKEMFDLIQKGLDSVLGEPKKMEQIVKDVEMCSTCEGVGCEDCHGAGYIERKP